MSSNNRKILILYGSQTGTAADYATQLSQTLQRYHFSCTVLSCDNYDITQLIYECTDKQDVHCAVLFVISTTGQGEPPDNMKSFYNFILQRNIPTNSLIALQYAVFGLGDSTYPLYNAISRRLSIRLKQLGANELLPRGLGDDQAQPSGSDTTYIPWVQQLCTVLVAKFGLPAGKQIIPENTLLPCKYNIECINNTNTIQHNNTDTVQYKSFGMASTQYKLLPVQCVHNERITHTNNEQDVRHIEFDISQHKSLHNYQCGDIVYVQPVNDLQRVTEFITETLQLQPDKVISIDTTDSSEHELPTQCTLQQLFQYHLDIFSIPKRSLLSIFAQFTANELHKNKLHELSQIEYSTDYIKYIVREHRNIAEVLYDFDTVHIPLQRLVECIPRLQPRQFSISSSSLYTPTKLSITVALVQWQTPLKRKRTGILSHYLTTLQPNTNVHIYIKRGSTFKLDNSKNVIMIGPGTGIAPFRAMCWQRYAESHNTTEHRSTEHVNNTTIDVYFGCRYKNGDFYYAHEWQQLLRSGVINSFNVAFSRDTDQTFDLNTSINSNINEHTFDPTTITTNKKYYVQHKLKQNSAHIYNTLFQQNGILMLAGSSGDMPRDIYNTMLDIVQEQEQCDEVHAQKRVKELQQQRRYLQETWG